MIITKAISKIERLQFQDDDWLEWIIYQCQDCFKMQTDDDASIICESSEYLLDHDCRSNWFRCVCEMCEMERQAEESESFMNDYLLEQAGGLDEVQRQERLRYYGEE